MKLDNKSLQAALVRQAKEINAEHEFELNYWKWKAENPVAVDPKCSIGDDGLRIWNAENRGVTESLETR